MAENIHHPSSGMDDNDVEGNRNAVIIENPAGTMDDSTVPVKDQSNAFLQMMKRNLFKSSKEKPADQDSFSSDSDNELWYSESSSDSDDEYYYRRGEYCLSDSEYEVENAAFVKEEPKSKDNILNDNWIKEIETPIKCNSKGCNVKRIKGDWFTCNDKDYCSACSNGQKANALMEDSELMRAIRLKDEDIALEILEDKNMKTDIEKRDLLGFSAVFLAILYLPGIKLLRRLIKKGAKIDYETDTGKTPLLFSILRKHTEAAKLLLNMKEAKGKSYFLTVENILKTPGKWTAENIQKSPDKWKQDTVLINALDFQLPEVAKAILLRIDPEPAEKQKQKDLHIETEKEADFVLKQKQAIKDLKEFLGRRDNSAMELASKYDYSECMKLILSYGGDIYRMGKIMQITPQVYKSFLDDQIKTQDQNYIVFDYSKLICRDDNKELKLIMDFTKLSPGHKTLLTHPLIEALLMMEWKRIQLLWLVYMLLKLTFMLLFFAIGVGKIGLQQFNCNNTDTDNNIRTNDEVLYLMSESTIKHMRETPMKIRSI